MNKAIKALIIVCRKENTKDFEEIARRVRKLDSAITILVVPDWLTSKMLPPEFLNLPMLVIYLCNPPPIEFKVATKLAVRAMNKVEEFEHFKQHNLPCLPIERFKWGMELDPAIYGDWVVLKPEHIQSTGKDVNMVPTKEIPNLKLSDFPENHLIREDSYYVQKFIKTGEMPAHFRVCTFLDEILFSTRLTSIYPYPDDNSNLKAFLSRTVASNKQDSRVREFIKDSEVNELAMRVSASLPKHPLLGIDILRDELDQKLYVIEANVGGNVWSFSSNMASHIPEYSPLLKKDRILQYGAWDRAAEALVRKTHELAR